MSCATSQSVIVCGDFNAHNVNWGSNRTDSRGSKLMDFVDYNDLVILNNGDPTYCGSTPSCIDLTFCSFNLSLNSHWQVARETLGSTHCIVELSLGLSPSYKCKNTVFVPKLIEKSVLNKKIVQIVQSSEFISSGKTVDMFSKLFFEEFKIKSKKKQRPPNPWWNAICNKASIFKTRFG